MDDRSAIAAYFPDRPPTWTEVGLAALIVVPTLVPPFRSGPPSVPALIGGFLTFTAALGPIANTTLGVRVGRWFRGIGKDGRAAVIVPFAVAVAAIFRIDAVPSELIADAAVGGLLACVLSVLAYVLLAGEVSGWWTTDR